MNSNSMQDQPPLSFFDKSFSDNPGDVLFCSLNDIDPFFLEKESLDIEFTLPQIVDPRNKLPISQSIFDYRVRQKPDIFRSANRSLLTKKEHSTCVAFLQSLKSNKQIFPHQVQCFEETTVKRENEKKLFLQFLMQYNNANYEKIYAPVQKLAGLYQQLYKLDAQRLMEKHPDGIFQIYTGFPMSRLCGNPDMNGGLSDVRVNSSGKALYLPASGVDFSKMRTRIESHFEYYTMKPMESDKPSLDHKEIQFEISSDSLVFLLCAGEYVDNPTEVLVIKTEKENGDCIIQINDPLPSRNAGVHTSESVVSKCVEAFLEQRGNPGILETQATGFNGSYSIQTFDSFMDNYTSKSCSNPRKMGPKFVRWRLDLDNGEKNIPILTRTRTPYKSANLRSDTCYSVKLEYKPQFGCEIPSKVNLIREWIELRLCTAPNSSLVRHRINAHTFATVLHENLSIADLEQQLERYYHVKIPRLLGSLGDFLSLLTNVSPGRYLLRYNPRFQEKLMLYAETTDASSKTCVTLHGLLREGPSDMAFMTLREFTSIDDSLCTAMHDFYQVLPCAFPPWRTKHPKIIDDRDYIVKKMQEKTSIKVAKKQLALQRRKVVKRLKKTQKLKQQKMQKQAENEDTQELENEINHDRILYGFNTTEAE